MNGVIIVLFLVAVFHFCLYYCNMDFFPKKNIVEPSLTQGSTLGPKIDSETLESSGILKSKEMLEKHLNELKQYSSITAHG